MAEQTSNRSIRTVQAAQPEQVHPKKKKGQQQGQQPVNLPKQSASTIASANAGAGTAYQALPAQPLATVPMLSPAKAV